VGIFGYLVGDSLLSKIIVGSVADYSWNAANLTMVIGAALGVVLCILTIKSEKA
jgi:sugar phosphate permease